MNVSEFIFDFFYKKGINTTFMVTGGQAMFLNDAVGKHGGYDIICTHHEQSATMSADAYGRILNKPAIALVTAGPGAMNALNGVAGGYTDSAPMIVISGQAALSYVHYQEKKEIRQYGIQGIRIDPIVRPITKYFVTVDDPQKIQYYLDKAYELATTGRPGPVWLEVPLDIQAKAVDIKTLKTYFSEKVTYPVDKAAAKVIEMLGKSKRPLLMVGQGIHLANARSLLSDIVERLQIPLITTRLGIDLIESSHPLYVGRPGNNGERAAHFAVQNADFILIIGSRLASPAVGHNAKDFGRNAYKVLIDIDPEELNKPGVDIDFKVHGDVLEFLEEFQKHIKQDYAQPKWIECCQNWKEKYPVVLPEYKDEEKVNSYYLIERLSALVKPSSMILVDTGSCFHVACQAWKIKKGQSFLTTGGLSSMGYWCAGIGAAAIDRNRDTIVITGDGSLQMNIQEFATIAHYKLPVKVFIINNNGYLLIRHTQRNFMEGRLIGEGPQTGVWCPDSLEIAKAYGIKGIRIHNTAELDEKIKEALAYQGPVIVDVLSPEWQVLQPKLASDKLPDGTLVAKPFEDLFPFLSPEELASNMLPPLERLK